MQLSLKDPQIREFISFAFVGGTAALAYLVVFFALNSLMTINPGINSSISYLVGMAVSYWGQSRLTFKNKNDGRKEVSRFIITSLIGITMSMVVMHFGVAKGGMNLYLGLFLTCISVPLMSFVLMKLWVFKRD